MTIVQLHGSTESPSQFSRTPWGSSREAFIPIKACTETNKTHMRIFNLYHFGTKKQSLEIGKISRKLEEKKPDEKFQIYPTFRSWKTESSNGEGLKKAENNQLTFKIHTFRRKHAICRSPKPEKCKKPESIIYSSSSHFHKKRLIVIEKTSLEAKLQMGLFFLMCNLQIRTHFLLSPIVSKFCGRAQKNTNIRLCVAKGELACLSLGQGTTEKKNILLLPLTWEQNYQN